MDAEDVWVIYNNQSARIIAVFGEYWRGVKKLEWYHTSPNAPKTGTVPNLEKYKLLSLEEALTMIKEDAVEVWTNIPSNRDKLRSLVY